MSFASDTKGELCRIDPPKKCCELAEIAGFLRVSGSLRLSGRGQITILCSTESAAAARHYRSLLQDYFHISTELGAAEGSAMRKGHRYYLMIDPLSKSEEVLRETGILMIREGSNYISDGIYDGLIRTKCCRKAYLRGIFIGAGTVANPEKSYDLEFVLSSRKLAQDLRKLIRSFEDLSAKITERKGKYIVYMKNAQYISDTLALMGAHSQVLRMEDVRIRKELLNKTVRITNCDAANTDRALDASEKQVQAIRWLQEQGEYARLSEKLQAIGDLRMEHPDASLRELGEMMDPPMQKSAVGNRLSRIVSKAEEAGFMKPDLL